MCIGIPMKVLEINGVEALCEINGIRRKIRIDIIESPAIGQYVLVHAGFALNVLMDETAKETIEMLNEL